MAIKTKFNKKSHQPENKNQHFSKKKDKVDEDSSQNDKPAKNHIFFDNDDEDNESDNAVPKKAHSAKKAQNSRQDAADIGRRWYQVYAEYNTAGELVEMKNSEIEELTNHCRKCFENELPFFEKSNPSDVKWLKTALHKGTSKDRANAGALLVQSNPLANLETLETLIGFSKTTNKNSTDSVDVIAELFMNALLPPDRKLLSMSQRGADWKALKKNDEVDITTKSRVYAYWHVETVLKDQYFEFLRNIQNAIQGTQAVNKKQAIICSSKLLSYAPEKEQMLLSMLVNKLGDPVKEVASKALHHLTEVSLKHPAMCGVIANETEKFLFRNNITEHAQHFALCFLSQLAPHGNLNVCTKLVNICLSFFKIVVKNGQINSKTMQAILLCLKNSISDVVTANRDNPGTDSGFMSKETQDTIYRLVQFANINVSLQTLALLLQIVTLSGTEQMHQRFYNALYKKLLDPELSTCGTKYAALFLHIVHRAIHSDKNTARAQAFIKRLLQASLHLPPHITCGCLIIISKLTKAKSELNRLKHREITAASTKTEDDSETGDAKESGEPASIYDPYRRVAESCGAEYIPRTELLALNNHYHPTVRLFAEKIINHTNNPYYGDPLIDFSLTRFLDRFAFKNPKKDTEEKAKSLVQSYHNKQYTPRGSRGRPVNQLTSTNCTEDERFIFEYLEGKRKRIAELGPNAYQGQQTDVDDDEFEAYLDGLVGKKKKKGDDEDFDFMGDFNESDGTTKAKKSKDEDDNDSDDWESDNDSAEEDNSNEEGDDMEVGSDDGSISLDGEMDEEDGSDLFESDGDSNGEVSDPEMDDEPKAKKSKMVNNKNFQKKLKNTDNMDSLFAAVEDFSEMLEDTGKSSKHGTLGEIFNQDKSSEKQLEWERSRLKRGGKFKGKQKPNPKRHRSQGQKKRARNGK